MTPLRSGSERQGTDRRSGRKSALRSPKLSAGASRDLDAARDALRAMIPQRLPTVEGLDMASVYVPCPQVAGDLFDIVQVSDDLLAFVLCDFRETGIPSAFASAVAKVSFIRHVQAFSSPRPVLVRMASELAAHLSETRFNGAFVGFLDLHSNRLSYCGMGDIHPVIYRHGEASAEALKLTSGTWENANGSVCHEHSVHLSPSDWLILCTNGLRRLYGSRFESELASCLQQTSPARFAADVRKRCEHAAASGGLVDDVAVMAVEVLSESRRNQILERLGFGPTAHVYLQFITYFEEMDSAIGVVLKEMDNLGYSDDSIRKMKITLTELLVNALYHGNGKDPSKRVTIGHTIDKKMVTVSVMDEGAGFDPASIPDPTLPENLTRDSGRGLYIVRCYVDEITFNDTGNRVTITKQSNQ